jgi:hypothetical protein
MIDFLACVPAKGGSLELLASIQTVSELQQAAVVLRYLVDEVPCGVYLTERELVVILVIKHIQ